MLLYGGGDFAVMAMTAVRLGKSEYALDLPGNGSLLLAVALMTAGYPGSGELPGFPKDGTWAVEFEGIQPFCC